MWIEKTGLDYFGARYFSSPLGRFTSPDPLMASGRPNNPQTWNRYTYTLNNPLRYIDPLGLYDSPAFDCEDDDPACLNDEQRRVQKKAGGKSFWSFLVPKQQNAFVNNTDALNSVPLSDGTSALNLVKDVNDVAKDRIYGNSDPSLIHFPEYNFVPRGWYDGPKLGKKLPKFLEVVAAVKNYHFLIKKDQLKKIRDNKIKEPIVLKSPSGNERPIKVEIIP